MARVPGLGALQPAAPGHAHLRGAVRGRLPCCGLSLVLLLVDNNLLPHQAEQCSGVCCPTVCTACLHWAPRTAQLARLPAPTPHCSVPQCVAGVRAGTHGAVPLPRHLARVFGLAPGQRRRRRGGAGCAGQGPGGAARRAHPALCCRRSAGGEGWDAWGRRGGSVWLCLHTARLQLPTQCSAVHLGGLIRAMHSHVRHCFPCRLPSCSLRSCRRRWAPRLLPRPFMRSWWTA